MVQKGICGFRTQTHESAVERALLAAGQILEGFAAANDAEFLLVHQDLGRAWPGIVIRSLSESVCACAPNSQQITRLWQFDRPIVKEAVARFTHGADNIRAYKLLAAPKHESDRVDGVVKSWANEIVHGGIYPLVTACSQKRNDSSEIPGESLAVSAL
jgi:hypothetical protein